MKAYVLVNTESAMLWKVAETSLKIEGVRAAHAVTGQFDVIIYVELIDIDMLGTLIEKLQSIPGVLRTQTAIVIPPRITGEA